MSRKGLHIGIVGVSAEGAALCYRTICTEGVEHFGSWGHPEVTLHTIPMSEHMEAISRDAWDEVGALLLESARKLASIGADFLICPDNTAHQAMPWVEAESPLPWLHIARVVAAEARERGYRKVGVLGTRYLMEGPVYVAPFEEAGIERVIPGPEAREKINSIIFDDLVYGRFEAPAREYFAKVIRELAGEGCEAVGLSCTEIPLLVSPSDSPLPTLDSTRLLARAALGRALGAPV
jgi:aspartate racemase